MLRGLVLRGMVLSGDGIECIVSSGGWGGEKEKMEVVLTLSHSMVQAG